MSPARLGRLGPVQVSVLAIAVAALGWLLVWPAYHAVQLRHSLLAVASLVAGQPDPVSATIVARPRLLTARHHADALGPVVRPLGWLAPRLAGWPWVGRPVARAAALWELADSTIDLGLAATDLVEPIVAEPAGSPEGHAALRRLLSPAYRLDVRARISRLHQTYERTDRAREALGEPPELLAPIRRHLAAWDAARPVARRVLPLLDRLAPRLPVLLGATSPATYLVLVQNRDELRATGGFITSVGTVRFEHGLPTRMAFQKVYLAEGADLVTMRPRPTGTHVEPPEPFPRYMGIGSWHLRDANWWADFPTSARQAARFWERLTGERVNGVIAFDEQLVQQVLAVTGPVSLPGHGVVTAETIKDVALADGFQGDQRSDWYAAQSQVTQRVATGMIEAIAHQSASGKLATANAVLTALRQKSLLVSVFDPEASAALKDAQADGSLQGTDSDWLYVVDSNLSYNKLSQFVQHEIDYTIALDEQHRPTAGYLTVQIENAFQQELANPNYPLAYYNGQRWDASAGRLRSTYGYYGGYLRILFPADTEVLSVDGFVEPATMSTESNRVVVGGYVGLGQGERRVVSVAVRPGGHRQAGGGYALVVQKQPGAPDRRVTIRVARSAPPGGEQVSPGPDTEQDGLLIWRRVVNEDLRFEVVGEVPVGGDGTGGGGQRPADAGPAAPVLAARLARAAASVGTCAEASRAWSSASCK